MFSQSELAHSPPHPSDPAALRADSGWRAMDFSPRSQIKFDNHRINNPHHHHHQHRHHGGGAEVQLFRPHSPEDESGVCSPPLWKTSPSRSHHNNQINHQNHHHHRINHQQSQASRAQAIARGQRELMEMVKNMPESSYELSLKDLVEPQTAGNENPEECLIAAEQKSSAVRRQESSKKKTNERKVKMVRSGSVENQGLLLNMVFPVGLGSCKKKTKKTKTKVSPRPQEADKKADGGEKEWWKKRFTAAAAVVAEGGESSGTSSRSGSRGSSSGSGSSRSSSSRSSSGRGRMGSGRLKDCWSFLHQDKSKPTK